MFHLSKKQFLKILFIKVISVEMGEGAKKINRERKTRPIFTAFSSHPLVILSCQGRSIKRGEGWTSEEKGSAERMVEGAVGDRDGRSRMEGQVLPRKEARLDGETADSRDSRDSRAGTPARGEHRSKAGCPGRHRRAEGRGGQGRRKEGREGGRIGGWARRNHVWKEKRSGWMGRMDG